MSNNANVDDASMKYLTSMSSFLHVMRLSINGGIKNPLHHLIEEKDIEVVHREIREHLYPRVMRLYTLCELIQALEYVMNEQDKNRLVAYLLRTSFFQDKQPEESISLISILQKETLSKQRDI